MNRSVLIQLLVILVIISSGYFVSQALLSLRTTPEKKMRLRTPPTVRIEIAKQQTMTLDIPAQGLVEPRNRIALLSEVNGKILSVSPDFLDGKLIPTKHLLLTINPIDYEVNLANSKASLLSAKLDFEDKNARYQPDSLSVKQSRENLNAARKRMEQAENDLANTQISSPFFALIENKQVDTGQFISRGTPLAHLINASVAEIHLPLQTEDLPLISEKPFTTVPGNPVSISLRLKDKNPTRQATITRIEAKIDETTRTFTAIATLEDPYALDNPENTAVPFGSFVSANIQSRQLENLFVLPASALQIDGSVYIVNEQNQLINRTVSVLHKTKNNIIIDKGLNVGEQVVITPLAEMFNGLEVRVIE